MDYRIQQTDLALLWKAGVNEDDMRHWVWVAEKALQIAGGKGQLITLAAPASADGSAQRRWPW